MRQIKAKLPFIHFFVRQCKKDFKLGVIVRRPDMYNADNLPAVFVHDLNGGCPTFRFYLSDEARHSSIIYLNTHLVSLLVTTFLFKFKENALITAVAAIYNSEFYSRRSSQVLYNERYMESKNSSREDNFNVWKTIKQ